MTTVQRGLWGGRRRDLPSYFEKLREEDQRTVREFVVSLGNLSRVRQRKYETYASKILVEIGANSGGSITRFEQITREDLLDYLAEVQESDYSEDTKRDIRQVSKRYFRWLHDDRFVDGIRLGTVEGVIGPEDVLTDLELDNLRNAAKGSIRNEALVETEYELGPRPGEFLGMRWSDVEFDDYGAKVTLFKRGLGTGKTQPRTIRVINAAPLLANWREHSPMRQHQAPVWVDVTHSGVKTSLTRHSLAYILGELAQKGHLEKRVNPYVFRHTRATNLAKTLTEAQLCSIFGWKIGSQMPRRYIHFSLRDVDDAILGAYGLKKKDAREVEAPKKCVRCGLVNPARSDLCSKCGMALSLTAAMKKDEELAEEAKKRIKLEERLARLEKSYFGHSDCDGLK